MVERLLETLVQTRTADSSAGIQADFIVVDSSPDNSDDAKKIRACCERLRACYVRGPESVRAKRNIGVNHAKRIDVDVVLFIDSDCEAQPGLFRVHLEGHRTLQSPFSLKPVGAVVGTTHFVGPDSNAYRIAALTPFLDSFSFAQRMPEAPWAPCTNFSVKLDLFEKLGGFSEGWSYRLGGDDAEFGRRINNAGYAILCRPEAVVLHSKDTWNRWSQIIERAWRWGRMEINIRRNEPSGNLCWIGPQPLFVALALAPLAVFRGPASLLALAILALLVAPLLMALSRVQKPSAILNYFLAEVLVLMFQFGSIYQSLRTLRPWLAYKEVVSHPMQIATSWDLRRSNAWTALVIVLLWSAFSW